MSHEKHKGRNGRRKTHAIERRIVQEWEAEATLRRTKRLRAAQERAKGHQQRQERPTA